MILFMTFMTAPWEESQQELATLAALEDRFMGQKYTTVCPAYNEY